MRKHVTTVFFTLILCSATGGLLLFPKEISLCIKEALSTCTNSLLPTLFPYLILSGFLIKSGALIPMYKILDPIMRHAFRLPGICSSALLLGLVAGYPNGAKTVVSLYSDGQCSRQEAEQTLAFCNNCGPGFLLSSVGCGIFGNVHLGVCLLFVHGISAILVGLLTAPSHCHAISNQTAYEHGKKEPIARAFVLSVTDAMQSFLTLSAFVLCFSGINRLIQLSNILSLPENLLPFTNGNNTFFLLGLLEMTSGVFHLTEGSVYERMILSSALVAWGGLCVHCQVLSLLQETDLSPIPYLKGKALQGLLAPLFMMVFLRQTSTALSLLAVIFVAILSFRKKAVEKKQNIYYNDIQQEAN